MSTKFSETITQLTIRYTNLNCSFALHNLSTTLENHRYTHTQTHFMLVSCGLYCRPKYEFSESLKLRDLIYNDFPTDVYETRQRSISNTHYRRQGIQLFTMISSICHNTHTLAATFRQQQQPQQQQQQHHNLFGG